MKTMYYSEVLKKSFDTEKECLAAEKKYEEEHKAELKAQEEKKAAANDVDGIFRKYLNLLEEADKVYGDYLKARQAFVEKYGYYHQTFTNKDTKYVSLFDVFDAFFKPW